MLDSKIALDAYDLYERETAPVGMIPIASGKVRYLPGRTATYSPKGETGARDILFSPTYEMPAKGGKGISEVWEQPTKTYTLPTDIPEALGIELTDKQSRGIYESRPVVNRDSVFSRLLDSKAQPEILDATLLNNPVVESLETLTWGNPLGANYEDKVAQASGNDSLTFAAENSNAQFMPNSGSPEMEMVEEETVPEDDSYFRIPGLFNFNKTVLKETGVFIVGVIILAIGILALTRGN